jgi:hypothetical protein
LKKENADLKTQRFKKAETPNLTHLGEFELVGTITQQTRSTSSQKEVRAEGDAKQLREELTDSITQTRNAQMNKSNDQWRESTLRKKFKELTGCDARTKKHSQLKS